MFRRLPSAIVRALLVVLLVLTPAALLPGVREDGAPFLMIAAMSAAVFTMIEYTVRSPSLVEFRDAPPFNRLRFFTLFSIVAAVTLSIRGLERATPVTDWVLKVANWSVATLDGNFSPFRLMFALTPAEATPDETLVFHSAVALSYLIAVAALLISVTWMYIRRWPRRGGPFDVWLNLPTFDPARGGDVVRRLKRDSWFNLVLGIFMPFLIPVLLAAVPPVSRLLSFEEPSSLVWAIAAWVFLPFSLVMRGTALARVAQMIQLHRRRKGLPEVVQPAR